MKKLIGTIEFVLGCMTIYTVGLFGVATVRFVVEKLRGATKSHDDDPVETNRRWFFSDKKRKEESNETVDTVVTGFTA